MVGIEESNIRNKFIKLYMFEEFTITCLIESRRYFIVNQTENSKYNYNLVNF